MRSVAELRAIHDANMASIDPDDFLADADFSCEPRYWMTFEEWCEFVESDENFDKMAKRERAGNSRPKGVECVQLCAACQRRADAAYKRLGSFSVCSICEGAISIWQAKHGKFSGAAGAPEAAPKGGE